MEHWLVDWLIRSSVVLALAWVACLCLRNASAALRAGVWRGAFLVLPLLPLAHAWLPPLAWVPASGPLVTSPAAVGLEAPVSPRVEQGAGPGIVLADAVTVPAAVESRAGHEVAASSRPAGDGAPVSMLTLAWALGALLAALRLALGLWRARSIVRAATPSVGEPTVRETDATEAPFVWDLRPFARPLLLLRRGADDRAARLHEEAHLARRDGPLLVFARLVAALAWPTPLVWFALRRLRLETEHACDDAVLRAGVRPSEYAAQLVALAAPRSLVGVPTMASGAALTRRVEAILTERSDRRPVSVPLALVVATFVITVGCAAAISAPVQATEQDDRDSAATDGSDEEQALVRAWNGALSRLIDLQEPSGAWQGDVGYKLNYDWRVTAADVPHVGATGLAVEALARAGHRIGAGPGGIALQRGVLWLLSTQREDGMFTANGSRMRDHAYALAGLSFVHLTHPGSEEFERSVKDGLSFSLDARGRQGWRFVPHASDVDLLETAHQWSAVRAAAIALDLSFYVELVPDAGWEERTGYLLSQAHIEVLKLARAAHVGESPRWPKGAYRYQPTENARVTANTTVAGTWLVASTQGWFRELEEWNEFRSAFEELRPSQVPANLRAETHFLTWDTRLLATRLLQLPGFQGEPWDSMRAYREPFATDLVADSYRSEVGSGDATVNAIAALALGLSATLH